MTGLASKAYGCLAGLALGDALGMPTEFMTPEQIAAEYGRVEGLVASPSWHPHIALPPGSITDDTGQALALADVYLREGEMTAQGAGQALLAWAESWREQLDLVLGPSTRRALDQLRAGMDPRQSGQAGKTNGAAMRIAPVGIARAGDLEATVADTVEACLPTHGTMLAISAAAAVSCAIAVAMCGAHSLDDILDAAAEGAIRGREHGAWTWTAPLDKRIGWAAQQVRSAENEVEALQALYDTVGVDMLVTESIPTAFGLVVLANGDPMQAVRYATNLGGDSDTIGAIAGAICGAWRGIDGLDRGMVAQVERVNKLDLAMVAQGLLAVGKEVE